MYNHGSLFAIIIIVVLLLVGGAFPLPSENASSSSAILDMFNVQTRPPGAPTNFTWDNPEIARGYALGHDYFRFIERDYDFPQTDAIVGPFIRVSELSQRILCAVNQTEFDWGVRVSPRTPISTNNPVLCLDFEADSVWIDAGLHSFVKSHPDTLAIDIYIGNNELPNHPRFISRDRLHHWPGQYPQIVDRTKGLIVVLGKAEIEHAIKFITYNRTSKTYNVGFNAAVEQPWPSQMKITFSLWQLLGLGVLLLLLYYQNTTQTASPIQADGLYAPNMKLLASYIIICAVTMAWFMVMNETAPIYGGNYIITDLSLLLSWFFALALTVALMAAYIGLSIREMKFDGIFEELLFYLPGAAIRQPAVAYRRIKLEYMLLFRGYSTAYIILCMPMLLLWNMETTSNIIVLVTTIGLFLGYALSYTYYMLALYRQNADRPTFHSMAFLPVLFVAILPVVFNFVVPALRDFHYQMTWPDPIVNHGPPFMRYGSLFLFVTGLISYVCSTSFTRGPVPLLY